MAWLATDLPDALVRVTPASGRRVGERHEEPQRRLVDALEVLGQLPGSVEQLAVHVELALAPRPVADAHGSAVTPAGEVRKVPLGEVTLTADAEHDRQVDALVHRGRSSSRHEVEELVGFVGAGGDPQRLDREAGIADPGVAVVPVALAARGLRQRRRRCGDDGTRRAERQRLQHPTAVVHELAVRAVVALVQRRPRAPRGDRVVELVGDGVLRPQFRRSIAGCSMVEREPDGVAGAHEEPRAGRGAIDLEGHRRGQHQPVPAAAGGDPSVDRLEEWVHEPVLGAWRELDVQLDLTIDAPELASQQVRRAPPDVVVARPGREDERVR